MASVKDIIAKMNRNLQKDYKPTKEPVENIKGVGSMVYSPTQGEAKKDVNKGLETIQTKKKQKEARIREYRRDASRMASVANKRIARLEKNGFKDSPAYQAYIANGGGKFGVKGKSHNEVQAEVARMRAFIESNTSTISGVNTYLKDIAKNTGIKYKNLKDLQAKSSKFFELSNKVEQYLRTVEDMASAIGYQKIWEAVNTYTTTNRIDLSSANIDIDDMIEDISNAITEYEKPENVFIKDGNFVTDDGKTTDSTWFKLKKD